MTRFDYFIVLAEMRTGSNFLEANLNALPGVSCVGEAFNPHFPGYPNREECLGVTKAERDADPLRLLDRVRAAEGLCGFRFFNDHDLRVLDHAVPDPRCAKIVLTRNPAESYVSWKIARATDQWKLTDVRRRRDSRIEFDAEEFETHLSRLQDFQVLLLNALQTTGQTAFYVDYEDLQNLDVMNGLAAWLGVDGRLESLDQKLKKQNPEPLTEKVANFADMEAALAQLDRFNLNRTPNFEPRRGPQVPSFVAGIEAPLLYMPVKGGPEGVVKRWLASLDGGKPADLQGRFNQKTLRQWKRANPGHRSFTVLRHPALRAHDVFCRKILDTGPGSFAEIRRILKQRFGLPLPEDPTDIAAHRLAYLEFLDFLKANLAGQTGIRIDPHWASQASVIESMAQFALPDVILREEELTEGLPALARQVGRIDARLPDRALVAAPVALADIHDAEVEAKVADTYQRDYLTFGFGPWQAD